MGVPVLLQGWCDGVEILTFLIEFKGVMLQTDAKFSEKLVSNAFAEDISNDGQRILLVLDHFVQVVQVANLADTAIFPWKNNGGTHPFTILLREKYLIE